MKIRTAVLAAACVLAFAPAASPQANRQGPRPGQGQAQQQKGRGAEQGRGTVQRNRETPRIQATDQQRELYRACTESQQRVRARAKQMTRLAGRQEFTTDDARRQRDQLRQQVRTMQQEHQRLMQGFTPEQEQAAREQIRQMERVQERLAARMTELDGAVDSNPFSFARVSQQAREVERAVKEWQKRHRELGNEIGIG